MNSLANTFLLATGLVCGCATDGTIRDLAPAGAVLLKADRDFAHYSREHGVAYAFQKFAAPEALSLPMGEAPIRGRDAIFQSMSEFPPGELLWQPVGADLARSGDFGYTWGTYEFRTNDAEGKPAMRHGKYVTVWKKQSDGSWKFVVDTGNSSPPPK